MAQVYRLDRGSLRPPRKTPQGFLRVDGYATRVGVLEYSDPSYPGGVRRELRKRETLFDALSLAGYEGAPVTDDHPSEMVTPSNAAVHAKGTVLSARADGDFVAVDLLISDGGLIDKAHNGKRELSTGYLIELDETPGEDPVFGRYDVEQKKITVNHLAIVSVGRAGPSARIRMDAAALSSCAPVFGTHDPNERIPSLENTMNDKQKIEQLEAKLAELTAQLQTAAGALAAEQTRADAAEGKLTGAVTRADAAEGQVTVLSAQVVQLRTERRDDAVIAAKDNEIAQLKDRTDKAERAVLELPEKIKVGVRVRTELERAAEKIMGAEFRADGLEDREVMLAVLEKRGHAIESDRNDAHIRGAFDVVVKAWQAGEDALQRIAISTTAQRNDAAAQTVNAPRSAAQAREQMVARNRGLKTN